MKTFSVVVLALMVKIATARRFHASDIPKAWTHKADVIKLVVEHAGSKIDYLSAARSLVSADTISVNLQLGHSFIPSDRDAEKETDSHALDGMILMAVLERATVYAHDRYAEYHLNTRSLAVSQTGTLREHLHPPRNEPDEPDDSVRSKYPHLDCFFRGMATVQNLKGNVTAEATGAKIALSLCDGNFHAQIWMANGDGIEIVPMQDGGYTALQDIHSKTNGTCGTVSINNEIVVHESTSRYGYSNRHSRQLCVKTPEVVIFNDESVHSVHGNVTEVFTAQIFNALALLYLDNDWDCRFELKLIGQITFRHGLPSGITQRNCSLPWYIQDLNLSTAENNACCASGDPCNPACPVGVSTKCLNVSGNATYADVFNAPVGCYSASMDTSSEICESNAAGLDTWTLRDSPEFRTTNGNDVYMLLRTFSSWIRTHKSELATIFGGEWDVSPFITDEPFGMGRGIIGLAPVGFSCSSRNPSVNSIGLSVTGASRLLAHEVGHNFGLGHVSRPAGCTGDECAVRGIMGSGVRDPTSRSTWLTHSADSMNAMYPSSAEYVRIGGGIYGNRSGTSGRVEVYNGSTWGTICSRSITQAEAQVACRSLGMTGGELIDRSNQVQSNINITMHQVSCNGGESNLRECSFRQGSGACTQSEEFFVSCTAIQTTCDGNGWLGGLACNEDAALITAEAQRLTNTFGWSVYCADNRPNLMTATNLRTARTHLAEAFNISFEGPTYYGASLALFDCRSALEVLRSHLGGVPGTGPKSCLDAHQDVNIREEYLCGDGVLEGSEECDPGFQSGDVCCLSNCTLAPSCQCPNTDPCCENGRFLPRGTVCRTSRSQTCDPQEVCSGSSSDCPLDTITEAGIGCAEDGNGAMCYDGYCLEPHGDSICRSIFPIRGELTPSGGAGSCGENIIRCNTCNVWCRNTSLSGTSYSNGYQGADGVPCGIGKQCYATSRHNGTTDDRGVVECVPSAILNLPPSTAPPTLSPSNSPTTSAPSFSPTTSEPSMAPTTPSPTVLVSAAQSQDDDNGGVIAMVIVIPLLIIGLLVVLVFVYKRKNNPFLRSSASKVKLETPADIQFELEAGNNSSVANPAWSEPNEI